MFVLYLKCFHLFLHSYQSIWFSQIISVPHNNTNPYCSVKVTWEKVHPIWPMLKVGIFHSFLSIPVQPNASRRWTGLRQNPSVLFNFIRNIYMMNSASLSAFFMCLPVRIHLLGGIVVGQWLWQWNHLSLAAQRQINKILATHLDLWCVQFLTFFQ